MSVSEARSRIVNIKSTLCLQYRLYTVCNMYVPLLTVDYVNNTSGRGEVGGSVRNGGGG